MSLELASAAAEYFYWTVTGRNPVTADVFVAFLRTGSDPSAATRWSPAVWYDGVSPLRTLRALIAGPGCSPLPVGAIQLPSGEFIPWVKLAQDPEVIIRQSTENLFVK